MNPVARPGTPPDEPPRPRQLTEDAACPSLTDAWPPDGQDPQPKQQPQQQPLAQDLWQSGREDQGWRRRPRRSVGRARTRSRPAGARQAHTCTWGARAGDRVSVGWSSLLGRSLGCLHARCAARSE
eukprot:scaffold957_cov402-Prasinococcus_capsulatus_cf.AAC.6